MFIGVGSLFVGGVIAFETRVAGFPALATDMGVGTLVPIAGSETEEVATGPAGWS